MYDYHTMPPKMDVKYDSPMANLKHLIMRIINERTVRSRTQHRCSACLRIFPSGVMIRKVKVVHDGFNTWKECPTCVELFKKDPIRFSDGFGILEYGCVDACLDVGQTPEMLLDEMLGERN